MLDVTVQVQVGQTGSVVNSDGHLPVDVAGRSDLLHVHQSCPSLWSRSRHRVSLPAHSTCTPGCIILQDSTMACSMSMYLLLLCVCSVLGATKLLVDG